VKRRHPLGRFAAKFPALIAAIEAAPPLESGPMPQGLVLFSRAGLGTIAMVPPVSVAYGELLNDLAQEFTAKRPLSRTAVESALQVAVLRAVPTLSEPDGLSLSDRVARALDELNADLHAPLLTWTIHTPVLGVGVPPSGVRLGGVQFRRVSASVLKRWRTGARSILQASPSSPEARKGSLRCSTAVLREHFADRIVATATVAAADYEAAKALASTTVRYVLDLINFYSDLVHPTSLRCGVRLPGDAQRTEPALVAFQADQQASLRPLRTYPLQDLDLTKLRTRKAIAAGTLFRWAHSAKPTKFQTRVLTAARWAGRATVEDRTEQAFLNYYIALEILLKGPDPKELSYRLAMRCAHLLGRDRKGRQWVRSTMKDLTDRRNAVVHAGQSDVTDQELQLARIFAKRAVMVAATGRFKSMSTAEFDDWLEARSVR
jgi:hypothetical protein